MKNIEDFAAALRYELGRSELTVEAYLRDIRQFADYITGGKPDTFESESVSTSDMRTWLASLSRDGLQMSSIKRKLQSVRAYYHYLMRSEKMTYDPTSPIEILLRRKELPKYVAGGEMERLLENETVNPGSFIEVRDRLVMLLLYTTGIRRAEALRLEDRDFDFSRGEVLIYGKGNKERLLPISEEVISLAKEYITLRDSNFSATTETSAFLRGGRGGAMNAATLASIVKQQLMLTSSGQKSPHVLRHTFATAMLNGGADINTVKEFLGHSSLATTQIYTHVSFADMKAAYNMAHPRAERGGKDEKSAKKSD